MGRYLLAAFTGVILTGACGNDDPAGPTTVLVQGQVISARSRAAIVGATVRIGNILSEDFVLTTTNGEGRFAARVEYFVCEAVWIQVEHPGYAQLSPIPDVCPGTIQTVEVHPQAVSSVISPQDPSVAAGGTVALSVQVTYADGTVEANGPAIWVIAADADIQAPSVCGSVPNEVAVQGTYTAPPTPPPGDCGALAGQAAVVAIPDTPTGAPLEASDTVVVTITP